MLVALILPMVLETTVNMTVGLADSIMAASVGEAAVSGVSLVDTINTLILNVFSALSTGGAVIAGQYLGNKQLREAKHAATELVWTMMALSTLLTVVMYGLRFFILNVVFGPIAPDVYQDAKTYLMIVSLSIPFMGLYNGAAAILRTQGDAKTVFRVSMKMGLINIAGNAIGIYGLHAGMAGVAVPTLIARAFGGIAMLLPLLHAGKELPITRSWKHHYNGAMVLRILHIGIPNGLENSIFQLGKIVLLSLVATFGTTAIAANSITQTLTRIQVIPGLAMMLAATTIVSRCVGAGSYEQARYYIKKLVLITYASLFVLDSTILLTLPNILGIYHLSEATTSVTYQLVLSYTIGAVLIWPLSFVIPSAFRAAGDVKVPMLISILSMIVFRIGSGYLLALGFHMGVLGVWLAMMIDWAFRSLMFMLRYFSGKWTRYKAI